MPNSDHEDVRVIWRRESQSNPRVSYGSSVTIHETTKKTIRFVPFYIRRTDGTNLAIKLVTYDKVNAKESKRKSLSMNQSAAHALLRCLREHVAIAAQNEDGSFLVIRMTNGTADVSDLETTRLASAVASILRQKDIVAHLISQELETELITLIRGAIRLRQLRSAVAGLREYLDTGVVDEKVYQNWCEQHSWAFGHTFLPADKVRSITTGDQVDLLLPAIRTGFRDIVEVKRPDANVLLYDKKHRDYYFSSEVSEVIGQCHRYLDMFCDQTKIGIADHPEIVAYHPRAIIVIGRSVEWKEDRLRALHGLNRRLIDMDIITYDHLLAQGERLIEVLSSEVEKDDLPF